MKNSPTLEELVDTAVAEKAAKTQPITFGSDPEFMLYSLDKKKMVSAIDVLQNDKYKPTDLGDGIKMYADNVLVEFSFPPATDIYTFIQRLRDCLWRGQKALGPAYRFVAQAAHIYDDEELANPKAKEGGCSPNFDVYKETANNPPVFDGGLRTGSFHIHIGAPYLQTRKQKDHMIKLLDCYVGLPSLIFDRDPTAQKRRKLYGQAGEFRPTDYGIEYRVLGPYALRSPALVELVMRLVNNALVRNCHTVPVKANTVVNAINNHDTGYAMSFCEEYLNSSLRLPVYGQGMVPPDLYRDWAIPIV